MRHFVVNPTLNESGLHVGGVVGFLNSIKFLSNRVGPSRIIVAWEGGGSSRRRAIFKEYKQGRRPQKLNRYYQDDLPDTVENRDNQISLIISLLRNTAVEQVYVDDCEADDIIGYMSKYRFSESRVVIASSDKDMYQLLDNKTIQWSPGQKKFITKNDVKEKFGISSTNFCTARCFVGDPSDGLPGVPRVGFASLSKRFPQLYEEDFVSVAQIIKSAKNEVEKSDLQVYTNIVENQAISKRNWRLMFLDIKNLSESQIRKIENVLSDENKTLNKMALVKQLSKEGIKNFDVDSFYSSVSSNLRSTRQ
tara:strand:+ start:557 stop:1477 length:921 start_codon:yes stop_codon:yes gene_type:complete